MRERDPDLVKILERENPLPATISLSEIPLEAYDRLNAVIENKLYVLSHNESDDEHFSNYSAQYNKIISVISVLKSL